MRDSQVVDEVCTDEVNVRVGNRVAEEVPGLRLVEKTLAAGSMRRDAAADEARAIRAE